MPNSLSYFALPLAAMLSLGDVRDTAFQSNPIPFPDAGLLVDLDAQRGIKIDTNPELAGEGFAADEVAIWKNQAERSRIVEFSNFRPGGRPRIRTSIEQLGGRSAVVFAEDELINYDDDALDHLTTGSGYTWIAIVAPHTQTPTRPPFSDVNGLFGNLRNGDMFEGFWAGFADENSIWAGPRNGVTFGRWNSDNPKIVGPVIEAGKFHLLAGRLGAGRGTVKAELFVNSDEAVGEALFPVNPSADPSRLAIGQERDATNHPGKESFHGEIARLLIWERPLGDDELKQAIQGLMLSYRLTGNHETD